MWRGAASATGDAAASPAALNGTYMWDPVADGVSQNSDSAANPTRAVPGEFVMKVDFVTVSIDDANSGDFFNYAPITGM